MVVVITPPRFNLLLCVLQGQEPAFIEAFGTDASIEGFDERVIRWFSRPAEIKNDSVAAGPVIKRFRGEFRTVIDTNRFRQRSLTGKPSQNVDLAWNLRVDFENAGKT